jgi:peptidoglycan hydrolase-like protein with peptidoglycan-binding domain
LPTYFWELVVARWKALPQELDAAVVQLISALRRLKDGSGLSQTQLAERTGYSKASWDRYLNGRTPVPRGAVEALATVCKADAVALLVLHEAAEQAWKTTGSAMSGPDATTVAENDDVDLEADATAATGPESQRRPRRLPNLRTALNSVVSAALGAAVALAIANPSPAATTTTSAPRPTPPKKPVVYQCHFTQTDGKWYAGNSTTTTDLVIYGENGPETAELQCLLEHAGISAGAVDGVFGHLTLRAVIQEQVAQHLDIDGQVGPMTWAALRG